MATIKISLPKPDGISSYEDAKYFIRQLELCVHHAKKSIEEMEKNGSFSEEGYVAYRHPKIDYDKFYEIIDNEFDQDIELEISN